MVRARIASSAAVCILAAATIAACGSSNNDNTSSSSASGTAASTTPAGSSASKLSQSTIDYGVKYTGGTAGKADASLPPVTIGLVYQNGGTPSFPEMGAAADAGVKFINQELGGIDGHPVALKVCTMLSEEDGQKCGAEMISAKVPVMSQGLAVIGNASLYKTIDAKIPVLIGSTSTGPDNTAPNVYNFSGGGTAVIYAMAADSKSLGLKNVALLSVGNVGGKYTMEKIAVPALDQLGVNHGKVVYYPDDATTPDIASALQAAGLSKADGVFLDPSTPQQCVSTFDTLKQQNLKIPVIATPICNSDEFVDHAGGQPDNWRLWGFGTSPRVTTDPESMVYNSVMDAYGQAKYKYVGFAPQEMRDILSIAQMGNKLGFAGLTPAGFKQQILAFPGPAFMSPGPIHCAKPSDPATPALCGEQAAGAQFTGGKWVALPPVTNEMGK